MKGREDTPMSYSDHIVMRNIDFECDVFFNVEPKDDQYKLSNFAFENLTIKAKKPDFPMNYVNEFTVRNVIVNGVKY